MGYFLPTLAATLIACSVATAQALEVPLEYQKHSEQRTGILPYGSAAIRVQEQRPEGIKALPDLKSETPLYGSLTLGDSRFLVVVDRAATTDAFYNRILLDRNRNQDLTDDPVIEGQSVRMQQREFHYAIVREPIDLEYECDGKPAHYSLRFYLSGRTPTKLIESGRSISNFVTLMAQTNCSYAASFEVDGQTYRVMLGDRNCNGSFSDRVSVNENVRSVGRTPLRPVGDSFYVTQKDTFSNDDFFVLGDRLLLGGRVFDLGIRPAAGKLALKKTQGELHPLKLSQAPERIHVHSDGFEHSIMMLRPGTVAKVPAGRYRLLSYQVTRTGDHDDVWRLAAAATQDSPYASLEGSDGATLTFGEPFLPRAEVPQAALQQLKNASTKTARLVFNIEGRGKELVNRLARVSGTKSSIEMSSKNKTLPLEPQYTIVTASGERVAHGSFEYG